MRTFTAGVLLVLLVTSTRAEEKNEQKAKEATVAFIKAVNARDLDAMLKLTEVPFFAYPKGKGKVFERTDDLKVALKGWLGGLKEDRKFSETVLEVSTFEAFLRKSGAKDTEPEVKMTREVLGKDGYIVTLGKDGKPAGTVLVAIKGGKAFVVGLPE